MYHPIRISIILGALMLGISAQAQKLSEVARPVPEALCEVAPLPEALAAKYERVKAERNKKYSTPKKATKESIDAEIIQKKTQYLSADKKDTVFHIAYNAADNYQIFHPNMKLLNTSHGREKIKGDGAKFNMKKDRISYAVFRNNNELCIVSHDHKYVDMSAFELSTTSEAIRIENGNKIALAVPTTSIAHGDYPMLHKVTCKHIASGAEYTFDIQMWWHKKLNLSGTKSALSLMPIHSLVSKNLGILCDLDSKLLMVVQLPLTIAADGRNGANGRKGRYGANGMNKRTWKDKKGNVHTIAGTCASAGQDGQDGQDGTDGGKLLLCISPELVAQYGMDGLIVTVDAGLGGKGGKGGEGGIHGKGSGCSGKAPDGRDGADGKDGLQGDFLYVLADVNGFYQQVFK